MSQITYNISGKMFAAFASTAFALTLIGVLSYVRKSNDWLVIHDPTGHYGGIFLFSYLIWLAAWAVLYVLFRNKKNMGSLKKWLLIFIASTVVSNGFIMASLSWKPFF